MTDIYYEGDGVSITVEVNSLTVRGYASPLKEGERPDYVFSGSVIALTDRACKLVGFSVNGSAGNLSIPHMKLLLGIFLEHGFSIVLMARREGRRVPFAKRIDDDGQLAGLYKGWWMLDVLAAKVAIKRRERRRNEKANDAVFAAGAE